MFVDKIKAIMACKGKTQTDVADKLNTSRQNISNKFRRGSISVEELISIVDICDCKLIITDGKGFNIELGKDDI